jgi:hypothetical protein
MQRLILTGLLVSLMIGGCTRTPSTVSNTRPPMPPPANERALDQTATAELPAALPDRVIVELVSRHETVQVLAGIDGLKYSVLTGGTVVASGISGEQLRLSHPRIYQRIHGGYATSDDTFEWAGMNLPADCVE